MFAFPSNTARLYVCLSPSGPFRTRLCSKSSSVIEVDTFEENTSPFLSKYHGTLYSFVLRMRVSFKFYLRIGEFCCCIIAILNTYYLYHTDSPVPLFYFIFFNFPDLFAICNDTFRYIQRMVCWEARAGRGVLCVIKFCSMIWERNPSANIRPEQNV
jgi:hypothetical protein